MSGKELAAEALAFSEALTQMVWMTGSAAEAARLGGRVEVLLWAQAELQIELGQLKATDRFADTRGLENFLSRVQDSLALVQDGSGEWAGLVRSGLDATGVGGTAVDPVPGAEMGG